MPDPDIIAAAQTSIDHRLKSAEESIKEANDAMAKTKATIDKDTKSRDKRNKDVASASKIIRVMLEPANQVANLLDGLGALYPPCKVASNALAALVKLESDRRENDSRIAAIYPDVSSTLMVLGALKPAFRNEKSLMDQLDTWVHAICQTLREFGGFCEAYYKEKLAKATLLHLIHASSNKEKLTEFRDKLANHKTDLIRLLSLQSAYISAATRDDITRVNKGVQLLVDFFIGIVDEQESQAIEFVRSQGGEENVQNNDRRLEMFASKFGVTLTSTLRSAIKQSVDDVFNDSQSVFTLKYEFALTQVSTKVVESREMIMNELRSGPYELIIDPDVKAVWKETRAKESTIKRRQLIDGLNYHFSIQFKKHRVEQHVERGDAWTLQFMTKVLYHPAIGDAIDNDASGYISVTEMNEFLREKPPTWTVPQWIAYWAYGWDVDNREYRDKINKALKRLKKLQEIPGDNAALVKKYMDAVEKKVDKIVNSVYSVTELEDTDTLKMEKLRNEWTSKVETAIRTHLKKIKYKLDYDTVSAVAGSERIEATYLSLIYLVIYRHVSLFSMKNVQELVVDEAIQCFETLFETFKDRILDLKATWRRQRFDLALQFEYYANGLFEDYYNDFLKESEDDDDEGSEWDEEDEWQSEGEDAPADQPAANQPAAPVKRPSAHRQSSSASAQQPSARALPGQRGLVQPQMQQSPSAAPAVQAKKPSLGTRVGSFLSDLTDELNTRKRGATPPPRSAGAPTPPPRNAGAPTLPPRNAEAPTPPPRNAGGAYPAPSGPAQANSTRALPAASSGYPQQRGVATRNLGPTHSGVDDDDDEQDNGTYVAPSFAQKAIASRGRDEQYRRVVSPEPEKSDEEGNDDVGDDRGGDNGSDGGDDNAGDGGGDDGSDGDDNASDGGDDNASDGGNDNGSDGGDDNASDGGNDNESDGGDANASDGANDNNEGSDGDGGGASDDNNDGDDGDDGGDDVGEDDGEDED